MSRPSGRVHGVMVTAGCRRPEDVHDERARRRLRLSAGPHRPRKRAPPGLTTFLVPLDSEGVEVQAVFTVSGERTNITFFSGVPVEDRWRISQVGAGWQSLMLALQDEHSAPFSPHLERMLQPTEAWASEADPTGRRRSSGRTSAGG